MDKKERPTLPPLAPEDWSERIGDLRDGFAGRLNVYRTMAHHPDLLRAWSGLRRHVVVENALGAERLEVVILRIAARLGSRYEWAHHVSRSRKIGFSDARIGTIRGAVAEMADNDALIARAVDALIDRTSLDDALLADLTAEIGTDGVLDLMATIGFYKTLACIAETFAVPLSDLETDPA